MQTDPLLGQIVGGRYQVLRRLGHGGMSTLYEVRHTTLDRRFALKALTGDRAADDTSLARFRQEAEVVGRFSHPRIVKIIDWQLLPNGSPSMVMELLEGEDLAARIRRDGPLDWPSITRLGDQLMDALVAAHAAGIVHRDLKPKNIFLVRNDGEEQVKLLDFGVAKILDADTRMTHTRRHLLGTPLYMSPEQAAGDARNLGPETDVWATGAILYEMAAGRPAFAAPTPSLAMYRIRYQGPDPLPPRDDLPRAFGELVARALDRDPARRITSMAELRTGLAAAPAHPEAAVHAASMDTVALSVPTRRHSVWPATLLGAVLLATAAAVIALRGC